MIGDRVHTIGQARRSHGTGAGMDAESIGIEALGFLADRDELMRRFLDLTGLEVEQLRAAAARPSFFVGLLDFLLASEADFLDFAGAAGLDPMAIGWARDELARAASHHRRPANTP